MRLAFPRNISWWLAVEAEAGTQILVVIPAVVVEVLAGCCPAHKVLPFRQPTRSPLGLVDRLAATMARGQMESRPPLAPLFHLAAAEAVLARALVLLAGLAEARVIESFRVAPV